MCRDLEAIKGGGVSWWEEVGTLSREGMVVHMNTEIDGGDEREDGELGED